MSLRNPWTLLPVATAAVVAAVLVMAGLREAATGSVAAVAPAPAWAPGSAVGRRSPGKPRPPVAISLMQVGRLEAGVPASLALQVRSAEPIEALELAVEGDEGLTVVSAIREAPGTGDTRYQSDGQAARFEISAVPMSGGTRNLSGLLRFTVNGVAQAAPFRLSLDVGGPVTVPPLRLQKPGREPARDANGELVYSMSAETIQR